MLVKKAVVDATFCAYPEIPMQETDCRLPKGKVRWISAEINQNDLEGEWCLFFVWFYPHFVLLPWLLRSFYSSFWTCFNLESVLCVTDSILLSRERNCFRLTFDLCLSASYVPSILVATGGGGCRLLHKS